MDSVPNHKLAARLQLLQCWCLGVITGTCVKLGHYRKDCMIVCSNTPGREQNTRTLCRKLQ